MEQFVSVIRNLRGDLCIDEMQKLLDENNYIDVNGEYGRPLKEAVKAHNLTALYFLLARRDVDVATCKCEAFLSVLDNRCCVNQTFHRNATIAFLENGRVLDNVDGMIEVLWRMIGYFSEFLPLVTSYITRRKKWQSICEAVSAKQTPYGHFPHLVALCKHFAPELISEQLVEEARVRHHDDSDFARLLTVPWLHKKPTKTLGKRAAVGNASGGDDDIDKDNIDNDNTRNAKQAKMETSVETIAAAESVLADEAAGAAAESVLADGATPNTARILRQMTLNGIDKFASRCVTLDGEDFETRFVRIKTDDNKFAWRKMRNSLFLEIFGVPRMNFMTDDTPLDISSVDWIAVKE